jgi:hypothetical protein
VEPRQGSKRVWRDVPRDERARLIAVVHGRRTATDPRDAANAAAYAQWMLDRNPPKPLRVMELLFAPVAIALSAYFASAHPGGIIVVAVFAGLHGLSLYQRSRRSKRLAASQETNAALCTGLGGVADIEFPAPDPNRPSPWTIRPGFRLALGVIGLAMMLLGLVLGLAVYKEAPRDKRSRAVRAIDAACRREHSSIQALRGLRLSGQAYTAHALAIETRLMHEIEAATPAAQRGQLINRMLGRQSDRIAGLDDWALAAHSNDRNGMFAANRNIYDAQMQFVGQAWALGARDCRAT